jgi:hypothetical protein
MKHAPDEFDGIGGRFIRDPETGKRFQWPDDSELTYAEALADYRAKQTKTAKQTAEVKDNG